MPTIRTTKVGRHTDHKIRGGERRSYEQPQVKIIGKVLTDAGFAVGDRLSVEALDGMVVLRRGEKATPGKGKSAAKKSTRAT